MDKWYKALLKKIKNSGDKIFVYDANNLLKDKNFYKELNSTYNLHEFKTDSNLTKFFYENNKILIFSNEKIQTKFIRDNLGFIDLNLNLVFPDLDTNMINNMDVSYFQEIYNYYMELKSQNKSMDTELLIFKSIWDIDKLKLKIPTENLKIAFSYFLDEKDFDDSILNIIFFNLNISKEDFNEKFIENILLDCVNDINNNKKPEFDLNDNLIQFYLSKINLNKNLISKNINFNTLEKYPILGIFKSDLNKEQIKNQIKSEIKIFKEQLNLFKTDSFDLNKVDNIFYLSKLFLKIIYEIQINDFSFEEFLNIEDCYQQLNKIFKTITEENIFDQLINYPYNKRPYTINKLLDYISYNLKDENIAFIVFDGMSYDEWFILKNCLKDFKINETESFAILPTITQYSRTSMFTNHLPKTFLDDKFKVKQNEEENGFKNYFLDKGISENDILFGRIDLNNDKIKTKKEDIDFEYLQGYKVIGLISNMFDDLSHDQSIFKKGKLNLYKNIKNSLKSTEIVHLLNKLKSFGYKIIISSDHGNIFCKGNGIKYNKNLEMDKLSKRCLIFNKETFANNILNENLDKVIKYQSNIFPNDLFFILATSNDFFSRKDDYSITHGSFMMEEWIVPVVILE
jgi:hypothetical protein